MSVSINIDKVVKKYGDTVVVNGLSVDIMPGEFFTLLRRYDFCRRESYQRCGDR